MAFELCSIQWKVLYVDEQKMLNLTVVFWNRTIFFFNVKPIVSNPD